MTIRTAPAPDAPARLMVGNLAPNSFTDSCHELVFGVGHSAGYYAGVNRPSVNSDEDAVYLITSPLRPTYIFGVLAGLAEREAETMIPANWVEEIMAADEPMLSWCDDCRTFTDHEFCDPTAN